MKRLIPAAFFLLVLVGASFAQGPLENHDVTINGLENAMTRVRNQEVAQHLEQVLARIQERTESRLQLREIEIEQTDEDGEEFEVRGLHTARFLGILPAQREVTYRLSGSEENPSLERVRNQWDFLYSGLN